MPLHPEFVSIADDLLRRYLPDRPTLHALGPQTLVAAYARATRLQGSDPREPVLRPSQVWTLQPGRTLGMGRIPTGVDERIVLTESVEPNQAVSRLACRVWFEHGTWWLRNAARSSRFAVVVSSPATTETLTNTSGPYPIRRRRMTVTIASLDQHATDGDGRWQPVEHRLTLINAAVPDDMPRLLTRRPVEQTTSEHTYGDGPPTWARDERRVLAAWAYADLIGLGTSWLSRNEVARTLLRQMKTGDKDPNERILARLRRRAAQESRRAMDSERNTPAFVAYLLERRAWLGAGIAELHDDFDRYGPSTPA